MPVLASDPAEVAKDDQDIAITEVCDQHFSDRPLEECREVFAAALADNLVTDEATECRSGGKAGSLNCLMKKLEAKWPGAGRLVAGLLLISFVVWVVTRIIPQKRN